MVNYDTQDGYSVSSFQSSPTPQQLLKQHSHSHQHNRITETLEHVLDAPAAAALLPATTLGSNGLTLQSHLLLPSTSILSIREVHFKHAGNYTCAPSNARAGTITIHVLRGTYVRSFVCSLNKSLIEIFSMSPVFRVSIWCFEQERLQSCVVPQILLLFVPCVHQETGRKTNYKQIKVN